MTETKPIELHIISFATNTHFDSCIALLRKDSKRPIQFLKNSFEVIQTHKQVEKFVLIYHLDKLKKIKDLYRVHHYLKTHKEGKNYSLCVVSSIHHPKLQELIQKIGCNDFINLITNPRAFRLKINRICERLELDRDSLFRGNHYSERTSKTGKVNRVGPIEMLYDYWSYAKWSVFKKVIGYWIFELKGPSPNVGRWIESEQEGEWHSGYFWWTPHDMDHPLFKNQNGAWVFKSKIIPEYKNQFWSFVGQEADLVYIDPYQNPRYKVKTTSMGNLEVASNSLTNEEITPLIDKSYEYEIKIINKAKPGFIGEIVKSNPVENINTESESALTQQEIKELDSLFDELKTVSPLDSPLIDPIEVLFSSKGANETPVVLVRDKSKSESNTSFISNKEIFKKIVDKKTQENFLIESDHKFKTAVMWTQGKKNISKVLSIRFNQTNKSIIFQIEPSHEFSELTKKITEKKILTIYFNVNLPRSAIFFNMSTKDLKVDGSQIIYSFQHEMWQVQRRKKFRYEFLAHDLKNKKKYIDPNAKISINGNSDTYSLADLSASGLRVNLPAEKQPLWKKDQIIDSIELTLNNHVIKCKGITRWIKKNLAGIEFSDMPKETQNWIHDQIVNELNDYFKSFPMQP
ncbi:MAG: PilZ domain-containing protein [Xanthomonadaceae bacterium]|nr:PilZ domain-containing protein [Xanthomonadaceae bacterium]